MRLDIGGGSVYDYFGGDVNVHVRITTPLLTLIHRLKDHTY